MNSTEIPAIVANKSKEIIRFIFILNFELFFILELKQIADFKKPNILIFITLSKIFEASSSKRDTMDYFNKGMKK